MILNNRPRKRFGFLTPKEKLYQILFNKKVAFTMKNLRDEYLD